MRESGFSDAADAVALHMSEGKFEHACDAIPDQLLDTLTICGTEVQCRDQLNAFDGLIDEVILVNVNYSAATTEGLMPVFRQLIDFTGTKS